MIKIITIEEMRIIERATAGAGISYDDMMEKAGRGVAEVVKGLFEDDFDGRRVAILIGPGNNGGDGLVVARLLAQETPLEVSCYLLKARDETDSQFVAARDAGVFIVEAASDQRWRVLRNLVASADVLVDALLGIGARLPIEGDLAKVLTHTIRVLQERRSMGQGRSIIRLDGTRSRDGVPTTVIAVDCPSGLDCDTGAIDKLAITADVTVTFAAAKPGLLRFPGAAKVGALVIGDIGSPPTLAEWENFATELADPLEVRASLPARSADSNKGTFGRAVIVAGSLSYTGAAYLAGLAAYRAGTGLVTIAIPQPLYPSLAAQLPEATWLLLPHDRGQLVKNAVNVFVEEVGKADALLLGPGWGHEKHTGEFLRGVLHPEDANKRASIGFLSDEQEADSHSGEAFVMPPLVIDADGLNLLSELDEWWDWLPADTILTPHPGEMSRLTGLEVKDIQADRLATARQFASQWNCIVVLKGAFTVVASPDGRVTVQPFANAALAKAGTGDVLAGAIVGLLAQGMLPAQAAIAGTYIHGLAGQLAVDAARSARSLLASEVAEHLGEALCLLEAM